MPKRNLDQAFANEIKEWTARKHKLLGSYIVPGAMKLKDSVRPKRIALVDGYAGPNEYGDSIVGSTVTMVKAAKTVIEQGAEARVFAFEANAGRYKRLCTNLASPIDEGVLVAFNRPHSEGIREVLTATIGWPMISFLDPQTATEMSIKDDIFPYCDRPRTDVLGIFQLSAACRDAARHVRDSTAKSRIHPSEYLGEGWRRATNEEGARDVFSREVHSCKMFTGLYALRKRYPQRYAYAIFGLSDSVHGFHLLSDAVARDFGILRKYDEGVTGRSLFAEAEEQDSFDELVRMLRRVIGTKGQMTGQKLAIASLERVENRAWLFGKFKESEYTRAAKLIKGEGSKDG